MREGEKFMKNPELPDLNASELDKNAAIEKAKKMLDADRFAIWLSKLREKEMRKVEKDQTTNESEKERERRINAGDQRRSKA